MRRIGLLTVLAVLVAGPAAASAKTIKLTGVVTGTESVQSKFGSGKVKETIVSVRQGKKRKGTLLIDQSANCAGTYCQINGTANLKVGTVKGKATLQLSNRAKGSGCILGPPRPCTHPKSSKGRIFGGGKGENINVGFGKTPTKKGTKFSIVLS